MRRRKLFEPREIVSENSDVETFLREFLCCFQGLLSEADEGFLHSLK